MNSNNYVKPLHWIFLGGAISLFAAILSPDFTSRVLISVMGSAITLYATLLHNRNSSRKTDGLKATLEEVQEENKKLGNELTKKTNEILQLTQTIKDTRDGGDGYCWISVEYTEGRFLFRVLNEGPIALEHIEINVTDQIKWENGYNLTHEQRMAYACRTYNVPVIAARNQTVLFYDREPSDYYYFGFGFSAKNGRWSQISKLYNPRPQYWFNVLYVDRLIQHETYFETVVLKKIIHPEFPRELLSYDADGNPMF